MARRPKKSDTVKAETPEVEVESASIDTNLNVASNRPEKDVPEVEQDVQEGRSQCGGVLCAAREEQGLSVQDVAKQLRLGTKQIEALEQDRFSVLPEATIVKGFIRNYAKLLKLPAEPLVAAYAELVPNKEEYAFALNPGINMKITEASKSSKSHYLLLVIALMVGLAIWFFYQNYVQKPSPVNPIPEIVEALPELALPMSERAEDVSSTQLEMPEATVEQPNIDSNGNLADASEAESPITADEEAGQTDDAIPENTVESLEAAVEEVPPAPVPGKTRLEFNATQETWVSVVNASGKEVYNKILYAGNHEVVDLWHPSQIVVGNAHGATLMVDGKPIDLAPYTRINVARVRLNR